MCDDLHWNCQIARLMTGDPTYWRQTDPKGVWMEQNPNPPYNDRISYRHLNIGWGWGYFTWLQINELTLMRAQIFAILKSVVLGRLQYSAISARASGLPARPTKLLNISASCTETSIVRAMNWIVTPESNNLHRASSEGAANQTHSGMNQWMGWPFERCPRRT